EIPPWQIVYLLTIFDFLAFFSWVPLGGGTMCAAWNRQTHEPMGYAGARRHVCLVEAPKLPAVVRGPAGLAIWNVDAGHRPGISGLPADAFSRLPGLRRVCVRHADVGPDALWRRRRRPCAPPDAAGEHTDPDDGAGLCAGVPDVHGARAAVARGRPGGRA